MRLHGEASVGKVVELLEALPHERHDERQLVGQHVPTDMHMHMHMTCTCHMQHVHVHVKGVESERMKSCSWWKGAYAGESDLMTPATRSRRWWHAWRWMWGPGQMKLEEEVQVVAVARLGRLR